MNILVTGATGFVGGALVRELTAAGHGVWVWVRGVSRARARLPRGVTLVPVAGGAPALDEALTRCDAIIHLAGESVAGRRWTAAWKRRILDSRVDTTRALVEGCRRVGAAAPGILVSTSAAGYYGDTGAARVEESASSGSDFLAEVCVAWEREAICARALGVRVVLIRVGIVLGREGGALAKMVAPIRLGVGGPLGSGEQFMPWIHRQDLVRVYAGALADSSLDGPINASAPTPATNAEVVRMIGRIIGRPTRLRVPPFALKLALGELAEVLLTGQRMIPAVLMARGFKFSFPALEGALRDALGEPG